MPFRRTVVILYAFSLYFNDPFGHRRELTTYVYDETKAELTRLA